MVLVLSVRISERSSLQGADLVTQNLQHLDFILLCPGPGNISEAQEEFVCFTRLIV